MVILAFGRPPAFVAPSIIPIIHSQKSSTCICREAPTALRRNLNRRIPIPTPSPSPDPSFISSTSVSASSAVPAPPEAPSKPTPRAAKLSPRSAKPRASNSALRAESSAAAASTPASDPTLPAPVAEEVQPKPLARMTGFNSPVVTSEALAAAMMGGRRIVSRAQVAGAISAYAHANGLQQLDNGREFRLDGLLKELFPGAGDVVLFSAIAGMIRGHVVSPADCGDEKFVREADEFRRKYLETAKPTGKRVPKTLDRRGKHSGAVQRKMKTLGRGIWVPVEMTPCLVKICGQDRLGRPDVTRLVWKYIRENGLQDEDDKRILRLDPLLAELCGGLYSINFLSLSKHIARNISPLKEKSVAENAAQQ